LAEGIKFTINDVRKIFEENTCHLISADYTRNTDRLEYVASCGHKNTIQFCNFQKGQGRLCKACLFKEKAKEKFVEVKKYFQDHGCELLAEEYVNNRHPLRYRCECGEISQIAFGDFKNGKRCSGCKSKRVSQAQLTPFLEVKKEFEKRGCVLLDESYYGAHDKLNYICKCGSRSRITFNNLKQRQFCKKCGIRKRAKSQMLDFSFIKNFFGEQDCILLTGEYKGKQTRLKYVCKCGEVAETTFHVFKKSRGCKKCGFKKISIKSKRSLSEIRGIYRQHGCELLEKEYKSTSTLMKFKCICGTISTKTLAAFKLVPECHNCMSEKERETNRLSYAQVETLFSSQGCKLTSPEYKGMYEALEYTCSCGNEVTKTLAAFKMCAECPECYSAKRTGPNNWRWNPNLTDVEREESRSRASLPEQRKWKRLVYRRDRYKCRCCGSGKSNSLRAHHLDGYNWCVVKRTDVDNGATLCDTCHKDFHKTYGYGNNTREQFDEWLRNKQRKQDAM
jgi:hypothetical protein